MILQEHLVKLPHYEVVKNEKNAKQSMSIPGQAFNLKLAMEQYKRGSLVERAKGFYEKQGFETPDFNSMSHIEKLQALAEYRQIAKATREKLDGNIAKANNKFKADVLEKQKQAKAKGGKASDDSGKPDSNRET